MKTIKKDGDLRRVSNKQAEDLVMFQGWEYTVKSEWKKIHSTNKKTISKEGVKTVNDNLSEKKKRKIRKESKREKQLQR